MLRAALGTRRCLSSVSESLRSELAASLVTRRKISKDQAESIIAGFGSDPSILRTNVEAVLNPSFPASALSELEAAGRAVLEREKAALSKPTNRAQITVHVPGSIPGARDTSFTIQAIPGQSLKDLAASNHQLGELLECACGGNMTCSTCHVYLDEASFKAWGGQPSDDEQDMLDIAFDPKEGSSRLGCQIRLKRDTPLVITIPKGVVNHYR